MLVNNSGQQLTKSPSPSVDECVVICIDVSGSMQSPFEADNDVRTRDRTRLDGVKQMFYGFRDRTTGKTT